MSYSSAIGMVLEYGGYFLKAAGEYAEEKQIERIADINAGTALQNAKILRAEADQTERVGVSEVVRSQRGARRIKASQLIGFSASGAEVSAGTPLAVMEDQAGEMVMDILQQYRNRLTQAQRLRYSAQGQEYRASLIKWEAESRVKAMQLEQYSKILMKTGQSIGSIGGGKDGGGQKVSMNTRNASWQTGRRAYA